MDDKLLYELRNVSYSYLGKFPALNRISLGIKRSETLALLGANGSGKSTLLLMLAGLIFSAEGIVKFRGEDLREESFALPIFQKNFRSSVGIVFQNSDIQLFNSNVGDELLFGLTQLGLSEYEINRRVEKYTELMEIGHLTDRHPQYLSIGEKKRVALASVLAMEPEVMLLDEPTSGLDPRTTRHLIDAVSVFGKEGHTIITSTQDIHIVPEIADRVVVLGEDKRIAGDGKAEDMLKDSDFLARHNLIHAHAHKHKETLHVHPHEHPSYDHSH